MIYPAYQHNQYLGIYIPIRMLNLSFERGVTQVSSASFASFAVVLCSEIFKKYKLAYQLSQAAMKMAEQYPNSQTAIETEWIHYGFLNRWGAPIHAAIEPLETLSRQLLQKGNVPYTAIALMNVIYIEIISGVPLNEVIEHIDLFIQEVTKYKAITVLIILHLEKAFCKGLLGLTEDPTDIHPKELTAEMSSFMKTGLDTLHPFFAKDFWTVMSLYLHEKYDEALLVAEKILKQKDVLPGTSYWNAFYFYYALILIALSNDPKGQKKHRKNLKNVLSKFKVWSEVAPQNYLHPMYLIQAEIDRLQGREFEAMDHYLMAIKQANAQGFLQDEALAYLLAGEFYLQTDRSIIGINFIKQARNKYERWGAVTKIKILDDKYPELLIRERVLPPPGAKTKTREETLRSHTSLEIGEELDLATIMTTSQALSKEIVFEKLLQTLMHTLIVNAGAESAFLILIEDQKFRVRAEITRRQLEALLEEIPLEENKDRLCVPIVKYVARTKEMLLLNDATQEGNFTLDAYVTTHQPFSIICLPILQQGQLKGILYLENRLSKGVFTSSRVKLLELLSAQLVISIENAQFYAKLEGKVAERTQELNSKNKELENTLNQLRTAQSQLIQQEKLASLGLLTSGIAHELKNPLNFVINFSQTAIETLSNLIEEMQKPTLDREEINELLNESKNQLVKIDTHGKRADGIINSMLTHARQGAGPAGTAKINDLLDLAIEFVEQAWRKKAPEIHEAIVKKWDPNLKAIQSFPTELERVFVNLIDNACYAIQMKGKQQIQGYVPKILVETMQTPDHIIVTIRDNGIGISKQNLAGDF